MFHSIYIGAIDGDVKRTECLSWGRLAQHLSLLQADDEAKVLGCIRKAADNVLYGFLCVGKKGTVISKQQLSDEFLIGFCACEETPKVEETAVCWETDVDAIWQVLICLMKHDAGAETHPCLTPLAMGKLPNRDPLCFT